MAKTYEELLEQAAIIRDETAAGKNTATRVGGTITDAVDYVKELQDTYKGIHAEAAAAKEAAAAAKSTASEAEMNATAAMNTARSASLNATAASGTANEAKAKADAAQESANTAQQTADAAKSTASEAKMNATSAMNTARSASLNATAASGTANEAKAKADAAQESANTAQQTADAAQTKNADQDTRINALLQDIPWEGRHMNMFTETGEYHIHGESTDANDGLPILNSGTIDARLTVLDSSLTRGTGEKTDTVVTQILRLSNRMGGDGHVYVRTAQAATKSQLATPSSTAWSTWEKLMGMFEKNAVSNATELDKYTSSGMYDGMFVFSPESQTTVSGLKIESGSTFLMVAVNGYAVAQTGVVPQVTQLLYVMPSGLDGSSGVRNAKLYTRTGIYVATTKTYTWGKFDGLAYASDISKLASDIQENSGLIQENQSAITANTQEIARVNSTATRAQETANSARETATAASTAAQEAKTAADTAQSTAKAAKQTAENEATARTEADTELQSQINGKQDNIDSLSKDEKAAFLVSLGLGKIGVVSQKQTWNDVGVEPAYVMSEKVEGFISKDNIDSLISYGFAFNEGTGYFELNGLTDISLQEALNIVAAGKPNYSLCNLHYYHKNIRTNLPILISVDDSNYFGSVSSAPIRFGSMAHKSDIEVFVYSQYIINCTKIQYTQVLEYALAFYGCNKLEKIYVIPGTANNCYLAFNGCVRLKELELVFLMCDVNLNSSAYLSAKSTHIMIAYAKNSNAITITLHPDAKARWEASEYYAEDSQTIITKNITIA